MNKYKNSRPVTRVLRAHAYVLTVMASMLLLARKEGVMATADFLWLKTIDRTLWYIAQQCRSTNGVHRSRRSFCSLACRTGSRAEVVGTYGRSSDRRFGECDFGSALSLRKRRTRAPRVGTAGGPLGVSKVSARN